MGRLGRVEGKVALVTGGASGIGAACCRDLAGEGALIAVVDRDVTASSRAMAELPASAMFFPCDITDPLAVEEMIDAVASRFGRLDIAVNNAGIAGPITPIAAYPVDMWNYVIATNLTGVFHCLRAEIPAMAASGGGAIVNLASIMGAVGYPGISAYVAAKHGVAGLTKVAALECGAQHIRVNAVGPSFIKTKLTLDALPEQAWETLAGLHALKRCAVPEEVAKLVTFLCSEDSSYITGTLHLVDGGYTAQ